MNTTPQAGVHRRLTPKPPIYGGRPTGGWVKTIRRAKPGGLFLLASGHWALCVQNLAEKCVGRTPPPWEKPGEVGSCCGRMISAPTHRAASPFVGPMFHPPPRLPPRPRNGKGQAVYSRAAQGSDFRAEGPSGPGGERKRVYILPAGAYCLLSVARSRNWGTGGKPPMSTGKAKCSSKASPGDLWFFPSLERTPFVPGRP